MPLPSRLTDGYRMRVRPCRGDSHGVSVRPCTADAEPVRVLASPGGAEIVRVIAVRGRVVDCVVAVNAAAVLAQMVVRAVVETEGRRPPRVLTPGAVTVRSVR